MTQLHKLMLYVICVYTGSQGFMKYLAKSLFSVKKVKFQNKHNLIAEFANLQEYYETHKKGA